MVVKFPELQEMLGDLLAGAVVADPNPQNPQNFQKEVLIMDLKFLEVLTMVVATDLTFLPE